MKYKLLNKLGLALALVLASAGAPAVSAWGPNRPTYTNENPADHAVFNSITNNAAVGNERDFVRIAEKGNGSTYVSELTIEPNKQYEVYIYYHNDASGIYNDAAHDYVGVARDTRLSSLFPASLKAGERGQVDGTITSSTTDPAAVWDEAYITAKEDLTLHYVTGSAKIYNSWGTNGANLSSERLFSQEGTLLGLNQLNGLILGCAEYSGHVVYTIQTKAVEKPDEPKPEEPETPDVPDEPEEPEEPEPDDPEVPDEPKPEEPETPKELPTTGPAEIALAIVVVIALVAGIVYWRKTSKAVKKATRHAKGRKSSKK